MEKHPWPNIIFKKNYVVETKTAVLHIKIKPKRLYKQKHKYNLIRRQLRLKAETIKYII